jgi:hypothetical protein
MLMCAITISIKIICLNLRVLSPLQDLAPILIFPRSLIAFPRSFAALSNEAIETSESHPRALLTRLYSVLRSPPNSDGISELRNPQRLRN